MNLEMLSHIRKWYLEYTRKYAREDGSMHLILQLKLDHSVRVASDCRDMATELLWPADDVMTAEATGVLHDVSRFEQFSKHGTFLDHKSFNHGERGYEIVVESGILDACSPKEKTAILNSIRYHNRRNIEAEMDADSMRFLKLIRDADKLDIIQIVNDTIRSNRHKEYPEILCHVSPDGGATPALIEEIRKHGYGSYEHVKTMTDMNLMRMTWVYNMNYLPALKRLADRRLLEQLDDTMPDDPDVRELMERAQRFVAEKLEPKSS